jgi:hypothetical protein
MRRSVNRASEGVPGNVTTFVDNVFAREQTASAELYVFSFSNGTSLYYTSYERDLLASETPDGNAYTHIPIKRSEKTDDIELTSAQVKITAPQINNFANNLIQSGQISVSINKMYLVDKTYQNLFTGLVLYVEKALGEAIATCESKMYYLSKAMPRVFFQSACNNTLFDDFCTLSKTPFTVSCSGVLSNNAYGKPTIFTMDSLISTVNGIAIPNGDTVGIKGFWQLGQALLGGEYRFITCHNPTGDLAGRTVLYLHYPFSGSVAGPVTLTLLPGCDKSAGYCVFPFSNITNFIGFPYFPASDPTVMPVAT